MQISLVFQAMRFKSDVSWFPVMHWWSHPSGEIVRCSVAEFHYGQAESAMAMEVIRQDSRWDRKFGINIFSFWKVFWWSGRWYWNCSEMNSIFCLLSWFNCWILWYLGVFMILSNWLLLDHHYFFPFAQTISLHCWRVQFDYTLCRILNRWYPCDLVCLGILVCFVYSKIIIKQVLPPLC